MGFSILSHKAVVSVVESERLTTLFSSDLKVANTTACVFNPDALKHKNPNK